jgi:hypothetical protein
MGMTRLGLGKEVIKTWIQTGYAEIVRLAKRRSLRLELCLDNVERTGRDTRDKATACASCESGCTPVSETLQKCEGTTKGVTSGPITLLAVHLFRVDGIALPRKAGNQVVWVSSRRKRLVWCGRACDGPGPSTRSLSGWVQRVNSAATKGRTRRAPSVMITCVWLAVSRVEAANFSFLFHPPESCRGPRRGLYVSFYHWVQGLRWWTGQAIAVMLVLLPLYKTSTRGSITSEDSACARLDVVSSKMFCHVTRLHSRIWHSVCLGLPLDSAR